MDLSKGQTVSSTIFLIRFRFDLVFVKILAVAGHLILAFPLQETGFSS